MSRVISVRQAGLTAYGLPETLPEGIDGFIAVLDCPEIGNIWNIRHQGSIWWERFLVTDCAGKNDARASDGLSGAEWMIGYGVLIEVDYLTAVRWGTIGRMTSVQVQR